MHHVGIRKKKISSFLCRHISGDTIMIFDAGRFGHRVCGQRGSFHDSLHGAGKKSGFPRTEAILDLLPPTRSTCVVTIVVSCSNPDSGGIRSPYVIVSSRWILFGLSSSYNDHIYNAFFFSSLRSQLSSNICCQHHAVSYYLSLHYYISYLYHPLVSCGGRGCVRCSRAYSTSWCTIALVGGAGCQQNWD